MNEFNWRLEGRDFQPTLEKWWEGKDFVVLPPELLPERIFVVSDNVDDIYAIPVYITDSKFAWMGFPTSKPNRHLPVSYKKEAFQYLLNIIEITMKYNGYDRLITTSFHPVIMDNLEDRGFQNTEQTNFFLKYIK